jgi:hypothetical protein
MNVIRYAAYSNGNHLLISANAGQIGPHLRLHGFGDSSAAVLGAEDNVNMVLAETVRHVPPLRGSSS